MMFTMKQLNNLKESYLYHFCKMKRYINMDGCLIY